MDKIYCDLEFIGYHEFFPEENKLGQNLVSAILKSIQGLLQKWWYW